MDEYDGPEELESADECLFRLEKEHDWCLHLIQCIDGHAMPDELEHWMPDEIADQAYKFLEVLRAKKQRIDSDIERLRRRGA